MSRLPTGWIAGRGVGSTEARPGPMRRRSRGAKRWLWSGGESRFQVCTQVVSGVAVLTLEGDLNREAVPVCRSALEAALRLRPAQVVLDLRRTRVHEDSRPAITLMARISGGRGTILWLAGLTVPARIVLRTGCAATYRVFPTVNAALDEAVSLSRPRRY